MKLISSRLIIKQSQLFYFLFLLLVSTSSQAFAQRSNSVYLELGGAAGHYSINYERVIAQYGDSRLYGSVGFSPSLLNTEGFSPRVPLQLKFSFPATKGVGIEIGGGLTPYWYTSKTSGYNAWTGSYSYENREFGTFWSGRVGIRHLIGDSAYLGCYYTPVFEESYDGRSVTHWGAVTIGVNF